MDVVMCDGDLDEPKEDDQNTLASSYPAKIPRPHETHPCKKKHLRLYMCPPAEDTAMQALGKLTRILHPPRNKGGGHKDPGLDLFTRAHVEQMLMLLQVFTQCDGASRGRWIDASEMVACAFGKGAKHYGWQLRNWCFKFFKDFKSLPRHLYGLQTSLILVDEDLKNEIMEYLQSKGKFVSAQDVVDCVSQPKVLGCLKCQKPITVQTACHWMRMMGYRWKKEPKGQYADGHEQEDVVMHQQKVYLPFMEWCTGRTRQWDENGKQVIDEGVACDSDGTLCRHHYVVIWFHDECIFYTHDHRIICWVHSSETAKPYAKGEG